MNSRYYFTLFVCAGVGMFPASSSAQQGGAIDLRLRLEPPTAVEPQAAVPSITGKIARDRAHQRRLQYRQRRAALAHVARLRRFGQVDFDTISKAYHTKKGALTQVALARQARQKQQQLAKQRALAEVKALAAVMRQRFEAEQRAMAEVERNLRQENPNHGDEALLKAVRASENNTGQAITETEDLPLLSKSVELSYIDPIRRSEAGGELKTKQLTPPNPGGAKPSLTFMNPNDPATRKEAAQLEAMIAFRKQKALKHAKQAREQAAVAQSAMSQDEQRQKLRELVDLYVTEKITPGEYYRRRALILGKPAPAEK